MKLNSSEREKLQANCTLYQWNSKNKQRVVSGSLESALNSEGIIITKKRVLLADSKELYSAKFSVGLFGAVPWANHENKIACFKFI